MRKEDKEIKYRPELAEQLKKCLDAALAFYNTNFKKAYYLELSKYCAASSPEESIFLKKVAECFSEQPFAEEMFHEEYEKTLTQKYHYEAVSTARAASLLFCVYKPVFELLEEKINTDELTKMEQYMVESFFKTLTAPLRNPNLEIKEGFSKCWYDRERGLNFLRDHRMSVEYLAKHCQSTIDIFSTPDEKELNSNDLEILSRCY